MKVSFLLSIFIVFPIGALFTGLVFILMYIKSRSKVSLGTGILWGLYSFYEYLMYARILCTGECNIRVDLLLIYPLLLVLSVISVISFFSKKVKQPVSR